MNLIQQSKLFLKASLLAFMLMSMSACDNISIPAKGEHGHDHSEHGDQHDEGNTNSIELSDQAIKNTGMIPGRVKLSPFIKTVTFPGMIIEQPSESKTIVATPMTGIVTNVYVHEGEAVQTG